MKPKARIFSCLSRLLTLAAMLIPSGSAVAQENDRVPTALLGGLFVVFLICGLVFYVFMALAVQTIANKTHTENAWLAWIPIANIFLLLNVAKKPLWWFLLFLIPIANIVVAILVWMAVAEARNKPNWWGILMILPLVNLVALGYLAWSD